MIVVKFILNLNLIDNLFINSNCNCYLYIFGALKVKINFEFLILEREEILNNHLNSQQINNLNLIKLLYIRKHDFQIFPVSNDVTSSF